MMPDQMRRELPRLAHLGGTRAVTTTPIVGDPARTRPNLYVPGTEELGVGEIRVTVLGSGDPFIRRSQASGRDGLGPGFDCGGPANDRV